ncbi:MAG: hypothetical protein UW94_C0013G0023 [Parcubacteria group bacterium GW2011_GWA2_45_14]|nr:MAG: hypothetical protein UW94_C0013G0023 [Parcubacteria group bacterium GW2011_GWA2_45_14]OGY35564.1 MAG: hypothetical protein A3B76_02205 [Candidatus Andersenbacteria bacterium RIFCSPHIGHO2_02_FULL_46_16]
MDRVKSAAEMVQEMERAISVMEKGIQELKLLVKDFGDHVLADDIIDGVKEKADDAGDDDEQEASTAVLRIESARADNEPLPEPQLVVSVGKRKETKREVLSPLEVVCRETGSLATAQRTFSAVVEGLRHVEQLLSKQDISSLTRLMDGISELFSVHGRTLSRETRSYLMDQTRDIVYVLIQEYANLIEQRMGKEATTIRQAMTMTGVVRLEKMIEEKDLPPIVIGYMEWLGLSFVGQKKATALLDELERTDFRLNPKHSDGLKDPTEEVSVMDDLEKARRRVERERKGKERAERDRVYRNEMRGSNTSPPKHGKR